MSMPEPDRRMGGWTGVGYDDIEVGRMFPPLMGMMRSADNYIRAWEKSGLRPKSEPACHPSC